MTEEELIETIMTDEELVEAIDTACITKCISDWVKTKDVENLQKASYYLDHLIKHILEKKGE